MTTTTTASVATGDSAQESMQQRVTAAARYLMYRRGVSGRQLGLALGLHSSGISNRLTGQVMWSTAEIEAMAKVLHVPWPWLMLPELELVQKCTAADSNRQPADSLQAAVRQGVGGSAATVASAASPRVSTSRVALVRPRFGVGASSPRRAIHAA